MATVVRVVQGDDLPGITLAIRDSSRAAAGQELDARDEATWAPVDLTGCVASSAVSRLGENTKIDEAAVFIEPGVEGKVVVSLLDCTFLLEAGEYDCELTFNFPGSGQQTVYDRIRMSVKERINAPATI